MGDECYELLRDVESVYSIVRLTLVNVLWINSVAKYTNNS